MSLSSLVGTVTTGFGSQFNVQAILPSSVLIVFLFSLIFLYSDNPPIGPNLSILVSNLEELDLTTGVALSVAVVVLSLVLQPFQNLIVRFLEGYWGESRLGTWMIRLGKATHEDIRDKLERESRIPATINRANPTQHDIELTNKKISAAVNLTQRFPSRERLLPTALGNVLRAGEDSAGQRYGLDTVELWPRLYPLIEDNLKNLIDDLRNQLDVVTRFSLYFLVCALASTIFYFVILYQAILTDLPLKIVLQEALGSGFPSNIVLSLSAFMLFVIKYSLWLVLPLTMLGLALISYRAAIYVGISYGKSMASAFDLYRFELRKKMHLGIPENLQEEIIRNSILSSFFFTGRTKSQVNYVHPEE